MKESNHKLLGNFSATFENLGTFCDFRQLLLVKFSASFDFNYFFTFFFDIYQLWKKNKQTNKRQLNSTGLYY